MLDKYNWDKINIHSYKKSPNTFYFQTASKSKLKDFIEDYLNLSKECDLLERKKNIANEILSFVDNKIYMTKNNLSIEKEQRKKICPICGKEFYCFTHLE